MHIVCTMHNSLCMHSTVSCITCMHFQCFKEKYCTLIVFHNRIFPKNWGGGQMHYWPPPNPFFGGAMAPLAPPVADPMTYRQRNSRWAWSPWGTWRAWGCCARLPSCRSSAGPCMPAATFPPHTTRTRSGGVLRATRGLRTLELGVCHTVHVYKWTAVYTVHSTLNGDTRTGALRRAWADVIALRHALRYVQRTVTARDVHLRATWNNILASDWEHMTPHLWIYSTLILLNTWLTVKETTVLLYGDLWRIGK